MPGKTGDSGRKNTAAPPDISADEMRAQLNRVVESPYLKGSARRRDLLCYLVDETLAGRGKKLKGYSVALAVFGRDDSFDPSSDPVVRLEAGRLRRSLDTYYVNAGKRDTLRITIPKGAYIAHFARLAQVDPVEPIDVTVPDSAPTQTREEVAAEAPGTGKVRSNRLFAVLAGLAVLAVAGLSWFWLRSDMPVLAAAKGPAVIVLPFEALDASGDTHRIASSITHDLISDLMRFPDLRLYSAQASVRQGADADPMELGRELGVSYAVRGNVQSNAGKLRLSAQLSDTSTGQVLWSGSFDRALTPGNLLGMRSELSATVATALGEPFGVVNAATAHRLTADGAPSMPSYACVLRAYEYRRSFEDKLFEPALACLKVAVAEEPDYAEAWAMLGWLHLETARQDMVPVAEHPASMIAAYDAAAHSVDLDSGNERGFEALAAIEFSNGNFAEAERLQRKALALNPHNPEVLVQLGWRLAVRGNWDEGLPFLEEAIARSANPPGWYFHMVAVHDYLEGNYASALAAAQRSANVGSAIGLSLAAISHAKLGDMDAAHNDLAEMAEAWPLLGRDPAAAYSNFQVDDQMVAFLVEGLRVAGWSSPDEEF